MSPESRERHTGQAVSTPADPLGFQDDPRVASILAAYLAELEAGRRPSREELLERHSEIAAELADCLDVVEFVHSAARSESSSGLLPAPADALPADTVLGDYRLVREIGRGATGIVYEAEQLPLGRRVALKVLSDAAALDPLKLKRFQIETQALAQLHHPHIVPIYGVGSDRGINHYSMQFIDGATLADVIRQNRLFGQGLIGASVGRPISYGNSPTTRSGSSDASGLSANGIGNGARSPTRAVRVSDSSLLRGRGAFRALAKLVIQAAQALEHAHALGILHRDIKPSNLLVDVTGNLWVTDFGLARFQDEPGLTRTGDVLGTLRYIAPELLLGRRAVHDPRSDVYSLGATLYELLTLQPVFDGRDRSAILRQIAQEEPTPPRRIDPAIPSDLETIVLKAMEKEPDRRYSTAAELAQDLGRFLEDKPIRARRPTLAGRTRKWARRHRATLVAAAVVAFLALAVATPLLWWEQRNTAGMYQDLRLTFAQADRGFEQMIRLSDELTVSGMARYSEATASPGAKATRATFFRQAIDFYDRLLRDPRMAKPMRALAYQRLGLARMVGTQDPHAQDDLRRALALYEELLASSPRDPALRFAISDVSMNLGVVLLSSRGMVAAEPYFRRATSIDEELAADFPDNPDFLAQLTERRLQIAGWMETSGMPREAEQGRIGLLAFYEELASTAASPDRARTITACYHRVSRALGDLGRAREQQEALRRGLKLDPQSPALLNELAWSLSLPRDTPPREADEAIALAKLALATDSKERAFWNTLGLAHLRAGHWPDAAEAVAKSIGLQSQGGDAADRLVMSLISSRRGDKSAALEWYIRALDWMSRYPDPDTSLLALRSEAERLLGRTPVSEPRPKR
jgi:serine/threonine protein kinase/Tfp pilus assembly protein PilF